MEEKDNLNTKLNAAYLTTFEIDFLSDAEVGWSEEKSFADHDEQPATKESVASPPQLKAEDTNKVRATVDPQFVASLPQQKAEETKEEIETESKEEVAQGEDGARFAGLGGSMQRDNRTGKDHISASDYATVLSEFVTVSIRSFCNCCN